MLNLKKIARVIPFKNLCTVSNNTQKHACLMLSSHILVEWEKTKHRELMKRISVNGLRNELVLHYNIVDDYTAAAIINQVPGVLTEKFSFDYAEIENNKYLFVKRG